MPGLFQSWHILRICLHLFTDPNWQRSSANNFQQLPVNTTIICGHCIVPIINSVKWVDPARPRVWRSIYFWCKVKVLLYVKVEQKYTLSFMAGREEHCCVELKNPSFSFGRTFDIWLGAFCLCASPPPPTAISGFLCWTDIYLGLIVTKGCVWHSTFRWCWC